MIRENQQLINRLNVLLDGVLVFSAFLLAYWLRVSFFPYEQSVPFRDYLITAILLVPLHLFTYGVLDMYDSYRTKRLYQELGQLLGANALDFGVLLTAFFALKMPHFARLALIFYFVLVNVFLGAKRLLTRKALHRMRMLGYNQKHIVIIGSGPVAQRCVREIRESSELGYQITGYISQRSQWKELSFLGNLSDVDSILEQNNPDEVIAALDADEYSLMPKIISACEGNGVKLSLIPIYAQYMPAHPQFDSLNGMPMINLRRIPLDNLGNAFMKRLMDIVGSLILIVLTSPLMLFAALGVLVSSPGPIIFKQQRVGRNKKLFYMYKFRSMRVNDRSTTAWSTNTDPRKTRFGSFIRKFSIDELPQFFNVLKGDMSLVGPRPELPHFVEQFKHEVPLYMVKHQVRPGITGWAQVHGMRGDTSIARRIEYDVYYIENWSVMLDIKILLMTLAHVKNDETLAK